MLTTMGDFESQDSYTASVNLTDILGVEDYYHKFTDKGQRSQAILTATKW